MPDKFKNKYRIASARLQNWDYGWPGAYFITICTHNKEHYFGYVKNSKMVFSKIGVIANVLWYEIKNHTNNVYLDEFVVMPNHIHGIIILNNDDIKNDDDNDNDNVVETRHALSLPIPKQQIIGQKRFQNQGKNTVSSIIGSYKSAVTKHCNRLGYQFAWQSRFYDRIIRNEKAFQTIKNYIINKPLKWGEDKFHGK